MPLEVVDYMQMGLCTAEMVDSVEGSIYHWLQWERKEKGNKEPCPVNGYCENNSKAERGVD